MAELHEPESSWWSAGIGPMRLERGPFAIAPDSWFLWRRMKRGPDVFAGHFTNKDEADVMALVLARVSDTAFIAARKELIAAAEAKIERTAA